MIMMLVAMLLGLILCLLLGVPYIDFLKKKSIGQYVKDVAPDGHAQKAGTPTTGGVFISVAVILASLITLMMAQKLNTTAFIILITFFFYALAGFQDDFLKIKGKMNKGLSARGKLFRQILIALLPSIYVMLTAGTTVRFGYDFWDLAWFFPVFAVVVITGSSNAYNLTDGLDGLASTCGIPVFIACAILGQCSHHSEVAIISAAVVGALIGFLKYNKAKAQVFMGDTGSLAIGGLLGTLAVMGKFEIWLLIIAGIFVIETLSVIIQVASFKLTGKRVFKMAPIHHHFELCGWNENKIVIFFALLSTLFSLLAVLVYNLFYRGLV